MMGNFLVFVVALNVIVLNNNNFVQCADECKTHADCKAQGYGGYWPYNYCCGGYVLFGSKDKDRSCISSRCLDRYCSTDNDCGDSTMCCRSNICVNKGCSGCTKNSDCYSSQVCCKKTFPFNQTICAASCLKQTCNFNDDCAGSEECCRSGKCTDTGCYVKCTSDSECNLSQYCCKKKSYYWDSCSKSCVGEICSTNEDCGAPNECCISNKCVDRGCSGCTSNSDCSTGQYCCKKRQWYALSECSAHCIGKSCNTNDDCGGPDETCNSDHRCTDIRIFQPWVIVVITVSLVVLLIGIGILVVVVWHIKRKQPADATQTRNMPLQNIQHQAGAEIRSQPNARYLNNPTYQRNTLPNQPGQNNNVAYPSHSYYPTSVQGSSSQAHIVQSENSAMQENENHGFHMNSSAGNNDNQGHQTAISSHQTQPKNEVHHYHNQMSHPVCHTLESQVQDVSPDTHSSGQQTLPQNAPYQSTNPSSKPQYQAE